MGYRYELEYLAEQLRDYIDRTLDEGVEFMVSSPAGRMPEFAERLRGYRDACEDMQKILRDPDHQFYRGLARYIAAARQMDGHDDEGCC